MWKEKGNTGIYCYKDYKKENQKEINHIIEKN